MKKIFILFLSVCILITNGYCEYRAKTTKITTAAPKPGAWRANTTLCYDYVGCFNNNPPFNNTQGYLPVDPSIINSTFVMFTPKTQYNGRVLSYKDINTIKNSVFDRNLPLKIIIHGFFNDYDTPWVHSLKDTLLTLDANVIIVGWGNGAKFPLYNNASSNTRLVGRELSLILDNITSVFYPNDPANFRIHCIGHSLGSHACGYAGHYSKSHSFFFDRITGLDPAGPFFEDTNELVRLDPGDAKFVDAYHTNGGVILNFCFGIVAPVGHVDFYFNDGSGQPGCASAFQDVSCSHNRAIDYFRESISSSCAYLGFKCKDYSSLVNGQCTSCDNDGCSSPGYYVDRKKFGSYYVMTQSSAPFCANQYIFTITPSDNISKTAGNFVLVADKDTTTIPDVSIASGTEFKKLFLMNSDISNGKVLTFTFNKKPKEWYQLSDPNASSFSFEKITINNLLNGEMLYSCQGKTIISDKQTIELRFSLNKC